MVFLSSLISYCLSRQLAPFSCFSSFCFIMTLWLWYRTLVFVFGWCWYFGFCFSFFTFTLFLSCPIFSVENQPWELVWQWTLDLTRANKIHWDLCWGFWEMACEWERTRGWHCQHHPASRKPKTNGDTAVDQRDRSSYILMPILETWIPIICEASFMSQ